jgi:hypothetical protein
MSDSRVPETRRIWNAPFEERFSGLVLRDWGIAVWTVFVLADDSSSRDGSESLRKREKR